MKNKEIDFEDPFSLSEEGFRKRFKRVKEEDLPEPIRKRREAARKKLKNRVTIYFDSDIVRSFKERSEREGVGYQTLMNEALRNSLEAAANADIKEELLKDKKFLKRLRSALAA